MPVPIIVKPDIIRYAIHQKTQTSEKIQRGFNVRGIGNACAVDFSGDYSRATYLAMNATGIPVPFISYHPALPIRCSRTWIEKMDGWNDVDVLSEYLTQYDPGAATNQLKITISAGLIQKVTNKDITNKLMSVSFAADTPGAPNFDPFVVELSRFVPTLVLTVETTQNFSPEQEANVYIGSVNKSPWRNYPSRTWMVHDIIGETTDRQIYHNMRQFMYNPETWDGFAVFRMENGKIPSVITIPTDLYPLGGNTDMSGNGWGRFKLAFEKDFTFVYPY